MLTKEMMDRIKRAGEYQKKAILELLPDGMEGHLEVIFGEVRLMAGEIAGNLARECVRSYWEAGKEGQCRADTKDGACGQNHTNAASESGVRHHSDQAQKAKETGSRSVRKVVID